MEYWPSASAEESIVPSAQNQPPDMTSNDIKKGAGGGSISPDDEHNHGRLLNRLEVHIEGAKRQKVI